MVSAVEERASRKQVATRSYEELPGPRGWPLVGNALQVELEHVHEVFEDWVRTYGPLVRYRFGAQHALLVADPQMADALLRARPRSLRRANVERVFAEMRMSGVFSAEGAAWRAQRKLAMEALSLKNTRVFYPTLRIVAQRFERRLATSSGKPIDITDDLMRFTVDVTTTLAFGQDMNTLEDRGDVLQTHLAHVFPMLARRTFAAVPYWRWFRLPIDRRFDRAMAEIHRYAEQLIASTRARLDALPEDERHALHFLDAMILARDDEGRPFGDEVIIGNTLTMLLAGEDTTAHSLAWALHLICDRPEVIARARTEIDAALGDERTPPDFDAASRMPYLDAIAHESMRLKPVAPLIGLDAIEDLVVGDVAVKAGTWLTIVSRAIATDARSFADPDAFKPERWLDGEVEGAHVANASIPFGSGPRACPGRTLALLEMRVVLATILRNFEIERAAPASDVRELFAFAMTPIGLRLRLKPR